MQTGAVGGVVNRPLTQEEVGQTKGTVGAGTAAAVGDVPGAGASTGGLAGVMSALSAFLPNVGGDFEVRLAEISQRMKETQGQVETDRATTEQEVKSQNLKENQLKLEDAAKKMEEAAEKAKSGNIWDKIAMAFQALGAVLMAVLGAVLIATGVGAGLGAALMISAALMIFSLVDQAVTEANDGMGIFASMADAIDKSLGGDGLTDEQKMAINISSMVAVAIVGIVAAVFTGGASVAGVAAQMAKSLATGIEVGTGIATATAQIGAAGTKADAAATRAEGQELQADAQDQEAAMSMLDDIIDQALQMLMASSERFNAMIDDAVSMLKDTGDSLSKARFAV